MCHVVAHVNHTLKRKRDSTIVAKFFKALLVVCGLSMASISHAQEEGEAPDFAAFLMKVREDALAAGVSNATLDATLSGLTPLERVVELDRNQPEVKLTLETYLSRRITPSIIEHGRKVVAENWDSLSAVGNKYNVQPRFIAAIWGMETSYGRYTGSFNVVQALATLAFDPRRSDYFRRELINALKIIDAGHISADAMLGSWAGAMGQSQFMPSSFLTFAQDFNGDGRRDIWTTREDVFASIAYYLAKNGWSADKTWGRPILLPNGTLQTDIEGTPPKGCKRAMKDHSVVLALPQWQEMGIRRLSGADLPGRVIDASIVQPDGPGTRAYLAYDNYRAILSYNCSNYYAIAVGTLADALVGVGG